MGLTGFNRRRRAVAAAGAHEASAAAVPDAIVTKLDVPPREGRGSGKQAWVDFAATVPGLVIDENDTRDEIAAKFDALVAENDAKLEAARVEQEAADAAAAALAASQSESAQSDGDDTQTAEAGAGDGSEQNGDDSSNE